MAITGDCDDDNYSINPGVQEICADGLDNDCDGVSDEADCISNQPWNIDWAALIFPASAVVSVGTPFNVYGHVYVVELTDISSGCDTDPALIAQIGIGPTYKD
jgi:hypothetical protein